MSSKKTPWGTVLTHGTLIFVTLATLYPLLIVLRIALSPGDSGANASLGPTSASTTRALSASSFTTWRRPGSPRPTGCIRAAPRRAGDRGA